MTENGKNGFGKVFLAFTIGAAVGGGLALLTAPRSGPDARKKLRSMVDDTNEKLHEMTEKTENRVKHAVQEGRDLLTGKTDQIKAAVKAGKEAMEAEKIKHEQKS
jgi:gas vesicle protein